MNTKYIIIADLNYIKSQMEELKKILTEEHNEVEATLLVEDIIRHIEAFIEEDI